MFKNHGVKNFNNREQAKETCLEKYGTKTPGENEIIKEKTKQTCNKIYGGDSPMCNKETQEKSKKTMIEKYGVEHVSKIPNHVDKVKHTKFEHYGDENYTNREKAKETCVENYGVENPSQSKEIKLKKIETCMKHYGVEHPMQDPGLHEKAQISAFKLKLHEQTGLKYRGGNELHFLDYCFEHNIKIGKALSIKYRLNGKNRTYHPDFYYVSKNLIVEVKSTYTMNDDYEENMAKQKACLEYGYNFIFIIDFNYDKFISIIS